MKYIITDQNELRLGGAFHQDMADTCAGRVVRAGHCVRNVDGTYTVFGESFGYGIKSQPEDAEIIRNIEEGFKFGSLGIVSELNRKQKLVNKSKNDIIHNFNDICKFGDKFFDNHIHEKEENLICSFIKDIETRIEQRRVRRLRIVQGILWVFIIAILIYEIYIHTL